MRGREELLSCLNRQGGGRRGQVGGRHYPKPSLANSWFFCCARRLLLLLKLNVGGGYGLEGRGEGGGGREGGKGGVALERDSQVSRHFSAFFRKLRVLQAGREKNWEEGLSDSLK